LDDHPVVVGRNWTPDPAIKLLGLIITVSLANPGMQAIVFAPEKVGTSDCKGRSSYTSHTSVSTASGICYLMSDSRPLPM
jgi:hypothetical protein